MKVYILDADVNKYRGIYYVNSDDVVEFQHRFNGAPPSRGAGTAKTLNPRKR